MKLTRNQLIFNAFFCSVLLGVIIWAFYMEYNRPWKQYQKEFNRLRYERTKNNISQTRGEKIQQLWLRDFGETDRCITCHQGIDNVDFSKEPQPFRTHSGDYLKYHPVEKYGCVVCHEGQGAALTIDAAHGEAKNWAKPLLKNHYTQSSCGRCHSMGNELPLSAELAGASVFADGWKLFMENNCTGCHKLSGYKRPDRIAPALTLIGSKVNRKWLVKWLKNPKDYLSKTKMPRFTLSDEEIGYMVDYLISLNDFASNIIERNISGEAIYKDNRNKEIATHLSVARNDKERSKYLREGKQLVNELGCLGCHTINNDGNGFAPDLSDIGNKVNSGWRYNFLKKPKFYQPKTTMPNIPMSDEETQSITTYLMSLKKDKKEIENNPPSPPFNKVGKGGFEDIAKGKKLVKDSGCTGCHEIEGLLSGYDAPPLDGIGDKRVDDLVFSNITNTDKTLINWLKIKVMDPKRFATAKIVTRMPNYDFKEKQAEALVTFLLSIRKDSAPLKYTKTLISPDKAEMKGKKVIEKYNCLGCHLINKEGGNIGPELTREAKKSRQEWLFAFLKSPYKIRPVPILKARMPNFNLSDKEVDTIIEYFASVSEEPYPYSFELKKEIYSDDIRNGEKLYQEIFACSGCHAVNGQGGEVGPEHTDMASRLKREWIEQWLKNPQSIQPDVRMPRFTFKDWEFEALTDYLMTLGNYRFTQIKSKD